VPVVKTLASLVLVALSLGASACSGTTDVGSTPYQLTFSRTGGLPPPIHDVTVIDSAAKTISYEATSFPQQTATLATSDLDAVSAAIDAANLEHAGGPFHGTCEDVLSYEGTLVIGGSSYDVSWEDCSNASLEAMGQTINKLDAKLFPTAGP
jgi:hypothetical protein